MDKGAVRKIYQEYFDIIDSYFGSIEHYLGEDEDSHIDLGVHIANYPLISDLIIDAIDDIGSEIKQFWGKSAKTVLDYVKSQNILKCVYSGDISPVILENFVKKCALYVDTIIIADPILNLSIFQKQIILDKKFYLNRLIRHVFNVWKLKDLVLADTPDNILIILPISIHSIGSENRNKLLYNANSRFVKYINKITKNDFVSTEDIAEHFAKLDTVELIHQEIKDPSLIPYTFKELISLENFLSGFTDTGKYSMIDDKSIGWSFSLYIQSQFIRVQEHKYFCNRIGAEPIYDYELPWFFFNYNAGGFYLDASIINALQKERFNWISKVPLSALKIFREENKLDYMRNILRTGITDLKAKNDDTLSYVSEQIEKNLREAFQQQEAEIKSLQKEVADITKKEIPITTSGFLAGFIPYLGNIVSLSSAGRDIKNHLKKRKESKEKLSEQKDNFINLLMKSYDED